MVQNCLNHIFVNSSHDTDFSSSGCGDKAVCAYYLRKKMFLGGLICLLFLLRSIAGTPVPGPATSDSTATRTPSASGNSITTDAADVTRQTNNPICSKFTCCVANFMAAPCCYMARTPECCECWERRGANRSKDPVVVIAPQEGPFGHSAVVLRTGDAESDPYEQQRGASSRGNPDGFQHDTDGSLGTGVTSDDERDGLLSWLFQGVRGRQVFTSHCF